MREGGNLATTLLVTKPPTPYRYAFMAGSIIFLLSRAGAVLFAPTITGDILVDVLTGLVLNLLAFGLVAPLLAFSKPVERLWHRVLRWRNAYHDFPDRRPLRSDVFWYWSLEADREGFFNQLSAILAFAILGLSILVPAPLPLLLVYGITITSVLGVLCFAAAACIQWRRIAGRLVSVRFLVFVRKRGNRFPSIEEMLEAERQRDWSRLLDSEAVLLREALRLLREWREAEVSSAGRFPLNLEVTPARVLWQELHLDLYSEVAWDLKRTVDSLDEECVRYLSLLVLELKRRLRLVEKLRI